MCSSAPSKEKPHLAVDSLAVNGGPVLCDLPCAQVELLVGRLPLVVPPRCNGAVAPRVRGAARVTAGERVGEVRAVDVLVGGAEVADGGLDLVAVRVEGGLVVGAAGLRRAELDLVAGAIGRLKSQRCCLLCEERRRKPGMVRGRDRVMTCIAPVGCCPRSPGRGVVDPSGC